MVISWFEWVQEFPSSIVIRESLYYSYLLAFHAVSMVMFAGFILMMDLRLVGLAFPATEVTHIQRRLFPWQMFLMVLASVSGAALFYGNPMRYYGKVFFWVKIALMIFAGLNALVFHWTTYRTVARWDSAAWPPPGARLAGGVSIALWAGVIVFGRITAYNWLTFD